jgi:signal transduction histidine kinase
LIIGLLVERKRRRSAEREARRHLATAAHLDRRAVAGELAASLTHEINQPLGAIVHNTEAAELMLNAGALAPEELREILSEIRKDDMRAAHILRKMRDLLRKEELTLERVDINELVTDTVELIAPEAAVRGAAVDVRLTRGLPDTAGDRVHLQQVLLNLLLNSLQAVTPQPKDRRHVIVRTERRERRVEVVVTDTGVGIPHDQLSRIFEPFFTTKGEGLGVGLSIVRTIIDAHGGQVSAENNEGPGATVRFWLPIKSAFQR